jgi:hypothetical protein
MNGRCGGKGHIGGIGKRMNGRQTVQKKGKIRHLEKATFLPIPTQIYLYISHLKYVQKWGALKGRIEYN